MKDTVQKAINHMDSLHNVDSEKIFRLQVQLDSLKTIRVSYSPLVIEERLAQASDTINYLGTMATGWGTIYAAISLIVVAITIGLPIWITNKSKKAVKKLDKKYNEKLAALDTANLEEISKLNDAFDAKITLQSERNNEELHQLNTTFSDKARELEKGYKDQIIRIESNFFVFRGQFSEASDDFVVAASNYILAAVKNLQFGESKKATVKANLLNFHRCFLRLTKEELPLLDQNLMIWIKDRKIENYITAFEKSKEYEHFSDIVQKIKDDLKLMKAKV